MLLQPRYGSDPVITLDCSPSAIAAPSIRQRNRLLGTLATLTDEQWDTPSRCEGWTVRDCMVHLESTNGYWEMSIRAGLAGTPTEYLASFDPAATPAAMVAGSELSTSEVLAKMRASAQSLNDLLDSLTDADYEMLAEAPPGHISISAVTHHALWDSWIHERDVLLPLGMDVAEEPDEIEACLRYAAALALSFGVVYGQASGTSTYSINAVEPNVALTATVDNAVAVTSGATSEQVVTGNAVELVEALSQRLPYGDGFPEEMQRAFDGLARAFDQVTD